MRPSFREKLSHRFSFADLRVVPIARTHPGVHDMGVARRRRKLLISAYNGVRFTLPEIALALCCTAVTVCFGYEIWQPTNTYGTHVAAVIVFVTLVVIMCGISAAFAAYTLVFCIGCVRSTSVCQDFTQHARPFVHVLMVGFCLTNVIVSMIFLNLFDGWASWTLLWVGIAEFFVLILMLGNLLCIH